MKYKKFILSVFVLFFIFIILPLSFAVNNETLLENTDSNNLTGNDYYFDSSHENDGNGSETNPYKSLTDDKFSDNSVIHLNNGEYELNKSRTVRGISIIGQDCDKTVVKFKNNNSILTNMATLTLQNLTLLDVSIINYGTVNATNVIFKNSVGYMKFSEGTNIVNSASNSFGGAIYSPNYETATPHIYINQCKFINNTAEYGGAIYMFGGVLNIKNSIFSDNTAYNYGGAIACEYNSKIIIDKTKFINSKSVNDAGGAIYIKTSKLTGDSINITDSQATFGAAITSLNSDIVLNKFNGFNNTAKYDGGAIYQFYASFTLRNSNLINNTAKNGGALFLDNTTSIILYKNTFANNSAIDCGGAIYSLSNSKIREDFSSYFNNTALNKNNFYKTSTVGIVIGNGNYSMYKYNSNFSGELPENYSSLNQGFITSVKDQQSGGNCWAFAGLAVLESCILKASGDNLDLSEENMKNLMEFYSDYGWYMDTNSGGYPSMIMGYLASWMGPVLEEDDINDDYSTLSPLLNSIMHVQNIKYIKRDNFSDINAIKEAIIKYGAVGTGIYYDSTYFNKKTSAYYSSITTLTNHAVCIVGWDDNYSKYNFINKPRGNGAFIVKNSWNTDWGDDGFLYVSYYDTSFARIGDSESIYTFILNDTIKFDKNYQYDIVGKTDYFLTPNSEIWCKNIFESTDDEFLAAISTYFEKNCKWEASIYVNDVLKLVRNGTGESGYYTIDLGNYIPLKTGDIFKVVFKIIADEASFAISEKISSNKVLYKEGISFFSTDGENWTDLYDYHASYSSHIYSSQVACIKAFTFKNKIMSAISINASLKGYNPTDIIASVVNEFGNPVSGGNVTFTINDKKFITPCRSGIAKLSVDLEEMTSTVIYANFDAEGYLSSQSNTTVNISKKTAKININASQFTTKTTINFKISKNINETLIVSLNNTNYTVNIYNGEGQLVLENIKSGNYTVKASILNMDYENTTSTKNIQINVKKSQIKAEDTLTYYNSNKLFTIKLIDENGENIPNRQLFFTLNGETIVKNTDENGSAGINLNLSVGQYNVDINFKGDENYINSSKTISISVNSTIIVESKNYTLNSKFVSQFLDENGDFLKNKKVSIMLDSKQYILTTDNNGLAYLNIDLKPGTYEILIINPNSDETLKQNIKVIKPITSNKDITMYYGAESTYKLRLIGDDGKPVGVNVKVTVNINDKTYTLKTDKNGYAKYKINLKPKTYKITAEYKGYKVSNKIIVKPVLTAKNISIKKANKIKFSVKLVNTKGNPLKNKKITFKIKNNVYKVKTNKKGIATLTLMNLKVGKHTVKVTYYTSTIYNTIQIKK